MSIYHVNKSLPRLDQIEKINDMVLELEGQTAQGKFNKQDISEIYTYLNISGSTKYYVEAVQGNTLLTYTGWSHLKEETGYSIWKYSPTNYTYNAVNELYFDDKILEDRGNAGAESATSFDKVYLYNGDSGAGYTDNTTEAASEGGTAFNLSDSTNDYLYMGDASTFSGIKFEFATKGAGHTLYVEYYSDTSGYNTWRELEVNANSLDDDTNAFSSDGKISWTVPDDWATNSVNSQTKYWIRISTSTDPTTTATAYYIIPYNSVPALLAMSQTQITNEDWAWCSYGTAIYVTIRNAGNASYEGSYYINSSSTATNLQNFFVYNHTYESSYENSTYSTGVLEAALDDDLIPFSHSGTTAVTIHDALVELFQNIANGVTQSETGVTNFDITIVNGIITSFTKN